MVEKEKKLRLTLKMEGDTIEGMEKHAHFNIVVSQDEDGIFMASCPAIPGCHSQGDTYEEAEKNIKEAIELCLKVAETDLVYKNSIDFGKPEAPRFFGISNVMVRLSPVL